MVTLAEHQQAIQKVLSSKSDSVSSWESIFRSQLKLIYLYEMRFHQKVDAHTPTSRLDWFEWFLRNDADPDLKFKTE
jgi:hypothetical protein